MTDLDEGTAVLSRQLRAAADLAPSGLGSTLDEVSRRGRRRIRTRRALTGGAGAAAVVTVAIVTVAIGTSVVAGTSAGHQPDRSTTAPAAGAPAPPAGGPSDAPSSPPAPPTSPVWDDPRSDGRHKPVGAVIETQTAYEGNQLALWFSRAPKQPSRLQLSMGTRNAAGILKSYGDAVKLEGDDLALGFGAGYAANGAQPRAYAMFGYVVGDVSRVTLTVDGRSRGASVATWSDNPRVHAWWVLGPRLKKWPVKGEPATGRVEDLTAYRADDTVVDRDPRGESISRG